MFDRMTEPNRSTSRRAQTIYSIFFSAGLLLNVVCDLTLPHHTHRPLWLTLQLLALALLLTGTLTGGVIYIRDRAAQKRTGSPLLR